MKNLRKLSFAFAIVTIFAISACEQEDLSTMRTDNDGKKTETNDPEG